MWYILTTALFCVLRLYFPWPVEHGNFIDGHGDSTKGHPNF